jgi:hypothetical protein
MLGNKRICDLLSEQAEAYRNAEIPDNKFEVLPEGKYDAEITKVEIKAFNKGDELKLKLRWEIRIISPDFRGRYLSKFTALDGEYIKYTKTDINTCEIEMKELTELDKLIEQKRFDGLKIVISVKVNEYNGEKYNNFFINKLIKENEDNF